MTSCFIVKHGIEVLAVGAVLLQKNLTFVQKWEHDEAFGLEFLVVAGEVEHASGVDAQKWVLCLDYFTLVKVEQAGVLIEQLCLCESSG